MRVVFDPAMKRDSWPTIPQTFHHPEPSSLTRIIMEINPRSDFIKDILRGFERLVGARWGQFVS